MTSKTKWSDLPYKDKAAYLTAISSFFLGWIILFIGLFIPPAGEIDPSVLTAFGTALVYAGSIFGVAIFLKNSKTDILDRVQDIVEDILRKRDGDGDDDGDGEARRKTARKTKTQQE